MKIKMLCLAVLSLFTFAVSAQTGNIKTIQADVFPMTEFPAAYGYRVLTKGNDSAPKSWGLTVTRANFSGKPMITYRNQKGKFFSVQKELTPFQLNRITVCFDNGKATMYLNGEVIGESTTTIPPEENNYALKVGAYTNGAFKFPGKVTNVQVLDKVAVPAKIKPEGTVTKHFSFLSTDVKKPIPFKVVNGNWIKSAWGFGEFSDNPDMKAFAVLDQVFPESFILTARVGTLDNAGNISLEFCRQDDKNGYKMLLQANSVQRAVYLYKKVNGVETLLNKVTSDKVKIPHTGNRFNPLTISIGRHEGMIHVRFNGVEILNAFDTTFKKGSVGLGVHERRAKFREVTVTSYSGYCVDNKPVAKPAQELILNTKSMRTVFFRDEKIVLNTEFINRESKEFPAEAVTFFFDGKKQSWNPGKIPALSSRSYEFVFDGKELSDGEYTVRVKSGKQTSDFKITLVTRPPEDLYTFYNWSDGKLDQMNANHFNGVTLSIYPKDDLQELKQALAKRNDYAMKHQMALGVHIPMLSQVPAGGKDMTIVRKDGSRGRLNGRNEKAQAYLKKRVAEIMEFLKDYPAINRILLDSEIENFIELSYGKDDIARAKKELGFDPPMADTSDVELDGTKGRRVSLPASVKKKTPAVFPVNDKNYRFMLWYWERGAGDNLVRAMIAPIIRKFRPDIKIHHDPYRDVPLSSRMKGMDFPGTWYYIHPDAGETFMSVESQLSCCRAGNMPERFQLDPSLWLYSQRIGPARDIWAGVQPANLYLTALHLGFAAKPEMIQIFSLNYLMPDSKPQFREKHIRAEISNFAKNFVRPLWSATRKLDREQPKTALILSFGSQIFSSSHWGGYGCSDANTILNLFWKANIPTAIITEENIRQGELAKYDQLLLYRTSHLPQDVFDKIKDYAAKGGNVLTEPDSPWAKLIPSTIKFPIKTEKMTNSTYYHVTRKGGYTADIVYAEQQKYAKELRKFRKDGVSFADSNSTELYIRTLQKNNCKYVFLMNDRRTFGDYFGKKYKAVYDAGLPLTAEISLKSSGTVYEFPAKKKHVLKNGKLSLDFKQVEGKLLIVYPDAVGSVKIDTVPTFRAGKKAVFKIHILSEKQKNLQGIQPVRVTLTAPDGRKTEVFTSAENGTALFTYLPGRNEPAGKWKLEAEELASGIKTIHEWTK